MCLLLVAVKRGSPTLRPTKGNKTPLVTPLSEVLPVSKEVLLLHKEVLPVRKEVLPVGKEVLGLGLGLRGLHTAPSQETQDSTPGGAQG